MCDIIAAKQIQDHAIYEYLAACRAGRAPAVRDAGELPVFITVKFHIAEEVIPR